MLHTLSCSPWKCDINTLINMFHKEDDLLLLQDGVLAAVDNNYFIEILKNTRIVIYALKEDIKARGLVNKISSGIVVVNYIGFVNLTIKHVSQMNWR